MTFRFVHTADWQIGKPFRNFSERMSGKLEEARLGIIDRVAASARQKGAAHVLVAGDIYDAEGLPKRALLQPLARMAAHEGIRWVLLPGNHDPARAGGLWQRLVALGLPANVTACLDAAPIDIAPGVALLPSPLRGKAQATDPTAWMDTAATAPAAIRIGLAHGSVQDFGSSGESAVRIDPARSKSAGLDYLALGDWHGTTRINERTWYSGTPEPDRFPDNEPGHVLAVSIAAPGATPYVERIPSAHYVWAKHRSAIGALSELDALDRSIAALCEAPARLLLQLAVAGSLTLSEHASLGAWLDRLDARLAYLEPDLSALRVRMESDDLAQLGEEGELRFAAERLQRAVSDPSDPRRDLAQAALVRLFQIAREVELETAP